MLVADGHLSQSRGIMVNSFMNEAEETGRRFWSGRRFLSSGVQLCVGSSSHCRGPHRTTRPSPASSAALKAKRIRLEASSSSCLMLVFFFPHRRPHRPRGSGQAGSTAPA